MKISMMKELLDAEVLCGEENLGKHVYSACGSDMMSDVLAFAKDQAVMVSGLVNPQVVRTAVMMDMVCIVLVRGKKATEQMLELAVDSDLVILSTPKTMFETCGLLYENGLRGGHKVE